MTLKGAFFSVNRQKKHHFGGCITREPYIAGIREWAHCKQAFIAVWARPTSNSCDVWLSCNTPICRVLIPNNLHNNHIIPQLWNPWCDIKSKSRIKSFYILSFVYIIHIKPFTCVKNLLDHPSTDTFLSNSSQPKVDGPPGFSSLCVCLCVCARAPGHSFQPRTLKIGMNITFGKP